MDMKFSDEELLKIPIGRLNLTDNIFIFNDLLKNITNIDTIKVKDYCISNSPFSHSGRIEIILEFSDIENLLFQVSGENLFEIKTRIVLEYNKIKLQIDKKQFYCFTNELNKFQDGLKYIEGLTFNDYLELHNAFRQIEKMILCKIEKDENNG